MGFHTESRPQFLKYSVVLTFLVKAFIKEEKSLSILFLQQDPRVTSALIQGTA